MGETDFFAAGFEAPFREPVVSLAAAAGLPEAAGCLTLRDTL